MHGGTSAGAPKNNRNAWKHGDRSAATEALLKTVRQTGRKLSILARARDGRPLTPGEHSQLIRMLILERPIEGLPDSGREELATADLPPDRQNRSTKRSCRNVRPR